MTSPENKKLLWSIKEASEQLSLSSRTLERMISNKQIPFIRIGRLVRIPVDETILWVAQKLLNVDNTNHARRGVPKSNGGNRTCQSVAKMVCSSGETRNFGGSASSMEAASELAEVLKLKTEKKRKHS